MITNRTIICLASDWDYDPTSKHQIMRVLGRYNDVVWVNYRGTRRPTPSLPDLRNALTTLKRITQGVRRVSPSMVQVTPPVIPAPGWPLVRQINEGLIVRSLRRVLAHLRRAEDRPVQVWTFAPDTAFLAGKFGEERFVYYCVDEHAQFEGFDPDYITREERAQERLCDVLITTSAALFESKRRVHPNTHLVRHGVDTAHFARAFEAELLVPEDLAGVRHPVIGFFGVLHHWIDCGLVGVVARQRPEYTFVLIGEALTDVSPLRGLPNVRMLGRRPYSTLPAYCQVFDAAILPFKPTAMTRSVNPIKMREYLAAGLPVVSTPLPEARLYEPDILIADGAEAFAQTCDRALGIEAPAGFQPLSAWVRRQRARRVAGDSWEAVVERLSVIVMRTAEADEPSVVSERTAASHRILM